jgi:hypothetical protein
MILCCLILLASEVDSAPSYESLLESFSQETPVQEGVIIRGGLEPPLPPVVVYPIETLTLIEAEKK